MIWENIKSINSSNENVFKYVFSLEGTKGAVAEAVLYKYPTFEERTVICCSTQSGCPVGCRFCGAGEFFIRSLTTGEIVDQVDHVIADKNIDVSKVQKGQIMFMSMGEPLLNLKNLMMAIDILEVKYPNWALLISTTAPNIGRNAFKHLNLFSAFHDTIGLQFSIHESTDEARDKLIPFKNKLTLKEISEYGTEWSCYSTRRPYFNYCVHDKNNTDRDVENLTKLFPPETWECTLSVICEVDEGVAASNNRQRELVSDFMQKMLQKGHSVRMFDPAGQDDIGGGCGQLWYVQEYAKNHPELTRKSAGTGLNKIHTPKEKK